MNWRMNLMNEIMELIFMTGSSPGLSNAQKERLKTLYSGLTEYGKEWLQIWAEDNNREIPEL